MNWGFGGEKGQAALETALVLPVILLIVMGVLTFGLMIYVKTLVVLSSSQAAKVGAYIYNDPTLTWEEKEEKIRATAYSFLSNGISGTDRSVTIKADGINITVKVTYNYKLIFPLLGEVLGSRAYIPLEYESTYMIQ